MSHLGDYDVATILYGKFTDCTALDLSEAQLEGCDVSVRFNGPARRVIYPADSNKLPTGNQLTIDGVAQ